MHAAGNGTAQQQQQQAHAPQWQPLPEVIGKRVAIVKRKTKETSVEVRLNIDGTGKCVTNTPVGFFNHMLDQLASHGLFDVYVEAQGDTWIDDHHTVEDIALALGSAFSQALGDRKGIHRCGCTAGGGGGGGGAAEGGV
jgi:imidazoleglycerol-phosphate dehydratase